MGKNGVLHGYSAGIHSRETSLETKCIKGRRDRAEGITEVL